METYSNNSVGALAYLFPDNIFIKRRFVTKNHAFFVLRILKRVNWVFLRGWLYFWWLLLLNCFLILFGIALILVLILSYELVIGSILRLFFLLWARFSRFRFNNLSYSLFRFGWDYLWFTKATVVGQSRPNLIINERAVLRLSYGFR